MICRRRSACGTIFLAAFITLSSFCYLAEARYYEHHRVAQDGRTSSGVDKEAPSEEGSRETEAVLRAQIGKLHKRLVAKDHMLKEAQKEVLGIRRAFSQTKDMMRSLKRALELEKEKEEKIQRSYLKEHVKHGKTRSKLKALESKLDETLERAEDPEITKWLARRAEDVGEFLDSPATGHILGESVSSVLSSSSNTLYSLESRLESNLSSIVSENRYSEIAAAILSYCLIFLPAGLVLVVMNKLTKSISVRQCILLGHLFNSAVVVACLLLSLFFGEDPLSSMRQVAPQKAIILMIAIALLSPIFFLLILWASVTGATNRERVYFLLETFLYGLVAYNYRVRVWKPIMSGDIDAGRVSASGYCVYLLAICIMIYLTVAAARARSNERLVADIENFVADGYIGVNEVRKSLPFRSSPKSE